jgi:serine phosphatase RsbU (regulator of sigma subunit)
MAIETERLGVLLIEDDDDDAMIVKDLLDDVGGPVELARGRTLSEGIGRLPGQIACVLVDLRLPDADGLDAVRRLRDAAPETAVIVLTGMAEEAAGEAAVEAGAQDYLVKGRVDGPLLVRAIRYAVVRRRAESVLARLRLAEARADETARLERGLVPHPLLTGTSVWVASSYLPGRRRALIGGDFYDVVELGSGALHVVIGDVSGRGPDEAALGAALRIAWRALTLSDTPADRVLDTLQAMIEAERRDGGLFATVCTLRIDPRDRSLVLRRAGHPAPMLLSGAAARSLPLEHGGPPIGMFAGAGGWEASEFSLPADWSVLLYTDGVIEGGDGAGGLLGEDGLRALVDARLADADWRADPAGLLSGIIQEARRRHGEPFSDDVALLALGAR